jgi:hypothetical protein
MPRFNHKLKTLFFIALTLVVAGSTKLAISAAPSVPCQTPGNFRRIPGYYLSTQNVDYLHFVTADFNGDSKLDMAGLLPGNRSVSIFLGDGLGGFAAPVNYSIANAGTIPDDLKIGDFNGDGKLDLISVNYGPTSQVGTCISTFSVLFGIGNGTFQNALTHEVNLCAREVEVADFDTNGKDDIAIRTSPISFTTQYRILIGLSDGNGMFGTPTSYTPNGTPYDLAVGDVNGDGKKDVIAAIGIISASHIDVYLNNGTGGLLAGTNVSGPAPTFDSITAGDLNGDGKADIAGFNMFTISTNPDGSIAVYLNNGTGGFTRTNYGAVKRFSRKTVLADFNGDGKPDIGTNDTILYGDGTGGFTRKDLHLVYSDPDFAVGDFNDDGRADFVRNFFNRYAFQLPTGNVNALATFLSDCNVPTRDKIDFDGDWKTDLAVWTPTTGQWMIRNTLTNTVRTQLWGGGDYNDVPVPGDYDGDDKADLAVFRLTNSAWYIIYSSDNTLHGQFWGASGDKPVPADYDGDGKIDFAVFRPSNGGWYVLRSSDNSLYAVAWGTSGDKPVQADYDGDYKTDIAVFRPSNGYWFIFRSSDSTYFAKEWGISTDKPVPGDYDSDGLADLMVYRPSTGLWWLSRSYNGETLALMVQNPNPAEDQPVPGDYDGDGTMDLAIRRPNSSLWRFELSRTFLYFLSDTTFGASGDTAVSSDYLIE